MYDVPMFLYVKSVCFDLPSICLIFLCPPTFYPPLSLRAFPCSFFLFFTLSPFISVEIFLRVHSFTVVLNDQLSTACFTAPFPFTVLTVPLLFLTENSIQFLQTHRNVPIV